MTLQFRYSETLQLKPSLKWQSPYGFLIKNSSPYSHTTMLMIDYTDCYSNQICISCWLYKNFFGNSHKILIFYLFHQIKSFHLCCFLTQVLIKITTLQFRLKKIVQSKTSSGWQSNQNFLRTLGFFPQTFKKCDTAI